MLEKLTKKQIDLMSEVRDEWIDIALHRDNFDKEEIEAGVKWMYYASNLNEPKVIFVDGPKDFTKKLSASVRASVSASVWALVLESVRNSVGASVGALVRASVRDSVGALVSASVRDSVRDSVWDSVSASVRDSVGALVSASVRDSVSYCSLLYDADDASFMEYFRKIGIVKNDNLDKYLGYLKAGAFYTFFFKKVAFVMRRPTTVKQDEQKRLHCTTGPALAFKDGTEIYKLRGVTFEKEWWKKIVDNKFKAEEVFAINNLEHRRIAYEFMDKTKMKKLKDYKILDEIKDDGYGYSMKLISFSVKNINEPLKYLNCFCPTTGREYFIGTDSDTCNEAKAKSFGFNASEIEFIKEW